MTNIENLITCLLPSFYGALNGYPSRLLNDVQTHLDVRDFGAEFFQRFYRFVRMPGNFSLRHAVLSVLRPKISPFLDPVFVRHSWPLNDSWFEGSLLHRTLIKHSDARLLPFFDTPISGSCTTQEWPRGSEEQQAHWYARHLRNLDLYAEMHSRL